MHYNAVANFYACHAGSNRFDLAATFVPEEMRQRPTLFATNLLQLRAANAGSNYANKHLPIAKHAGKLNVCERQRCVKFSEDSGAHFH
jgi:hypothetical protein